ncbi:hypothetical protein [uncultured Kordia sp.]|uniref:hypothetical protein n=1 Tax=uncultured Kordia sp. TaxID=507699 RepID=UPI00262BFDDC|nr:hypothetical protein [uncultured Kordia sp.]
MKPIYNEVLVTYTFDNGTLTVENNAIETTDFSPKPSGRMYSGIYSYLIFEFNGNAYLVVENDQFGQAEIGIMTLNPDNTLTIDQTEIPLTDGIYQYVLNFER